jgi:hypothetical protein
MPVQYVRDDARRRIRVTITDPFTLADLVASVERQLADGAWRYGLLVDSRASYAGLGPVDTQSFVSSVRELIAAHGPRGPIAIAARESGSIATTQRYIFVSGKTEPIEVFWDIADAQQWLDEQRDLKRRDPEED